MTKEQETIEKLNRFKAIKILYGNTFAMTLEQLKTVQEDIETVLNMLKENSAEIEQKNTELAEKNAEIDDLKQALARNIANNVTSSMKKSAKSKEDLEMLNKGWQIELEKKDKQIKFMANFINDNTPYTKDTKELENEEGIRTLDFTVKYFERKSKE